MLNPSNERLRRIFASEQVPELVTKQQVAEVLGISTASVKEIMQRAGINVVRPEHSGRAANYYNKAAVIQLAEARKLSTHRKPGPPAGYRLKKFTAKPIGVKETAEAMRLRTRLERVSPSFSQLSGADQVALLRDLTCPDDPAPQLRSGKYDKDEFRTAIRMVVAPEHRIAVEQCMSTYYSRCINFCRLQPDLVVATLYDLWKDSHRVFS